MLKKTNEEKVLRDPIHGYIHVNLQVVWDCINAKEFQRLRRVHQLGGTYEVYHTAEHSRFAHSLGVYEIVRRMVHEVEGLTQLSEYEKATVMLAGLLHDIGHGPFSHAFEVVMPKTHEEYTVEIILGDTQVHHILATVSKDLPVDIANIIQYKHFNDLLNQVVSGQLDADRMDYLLRDAYFTGTSYGNFDLERVLRTMRVKDQKIVVKESGIHTVVDYIMARYHMYWQVYYHPTTRSFEAILNSLFRRMKDVYDTQPELLSEVKMFIPFLTQQPNLEDHFLMDEPAAFFGFSLLRNSSDKILADLAHRLLDRDLFDYLSYQDDSDLIPVREKVKQLGYDDEYYVVTDSASQKPYRPYKSENAHNIWILKSNDTIAELSEVSDIVSSIVGGNEKKDKKVFFPIK